MKLERLKIDPEACMLALRQDTDLLAVAELLTLARAKPIKYPIKSPGTLTRIVGDRGLRTPSGERYTREQINTYIPKAFFPIESEEAFAAALTISMRLGREMHYCEIRTERLKKKKRKK